MKYLLLLMLLSPEDAGAPPTPASPGAAVWGAITEPGPGKPQSFGRYGGGCLDGAVRLPLRGRGYFVGRPERGRVFGHPGLIAFLQALGALVDKHKLPLLPIGDLSQPRGGPAPSGHASHQTGLDVDIAYLAPEDGKVPSVVDLEHQKLNARWNVKIARILEMVARDAHVDRLFVNPVIKRTLCAMPGGSADKSERSWLRKVRPWWGHHDHFHVRLPCPDDSPLCESQPALPEGDGCGELGWWFQKKSDERDRERKNSQNRVGSSPALPTPCLSLVPSP
jgi:penicillin-insensitive murein endopeptidase